MTSANEKLNSISVCSPNFTLAAIASGNASSFGTTPNRYAPSPERFNSIFTALPLALPFASARDSSAMRSALAAALRAPLASRRIGDETKHSAA